MDSGTVEEKTAKMAKDYEGNSGAIEDDERNWATAKKEKKRRKKRKRKHEDNKEKKI